MIIWKSIFAEYMLCEEKLQKNHAHKVKHVAQKLFNIPLPSAVHSE